MADLVQTFGKTIGKLAADDPVRSRKLLVTGLKTFRGILRYMPDKRLPPSRQYSTLRTVGGNGDYPHVRGNAGRVHQRFPGRGGFC